MSCASEPGSRTRSLAAPPVAAYTFGKNMNDAPVATRDAPVESKLLLDSVLMAAITSPFVAYCAAMWRSQFGLLPLELNKPKGDIKFSALWWGSRDELVC